ncbi:MAG: ribonuclease R [bacterium]
MPFPSKQQIQDFITTYQESGKGKVTRREIARAFQLKGEARARLRRLLKEMAAEGLIDLEGKRSSAKGSLPPVIVMDIISLDDEGDLICSPTNWKESFAPPRLILPDRAASKTRPALGKGDRFVGRLTRQADGSYLVKPIKQIKQDNERILGVFEKTRHGGKVRSVNRKQSRDLLIDRGDDRGAQSGDLVWAELKKSKSYGPPHARISEIIGTIEDQSSFSLIAIANHNIRTDFPVKVSQEAEQAQLPDMHRPQDSGREDFRDLPFITIDPADARDHDDAVVAMPDRDEKNPDGWRVMVAIADVAYFVTPGSALDKEAQQRGNSTYFPDQVVPMLPERLSTNLCSLKQGQDRPAIVADMRFNRNGNKISHQFTRAIIKSHLNIDYKHVQEAYDGHPGADIKPLMSTIFTPLFKAYKALSIARDKRGPLDLDLPERKILFDTNGHVKDVVLKERHEANRLIEEFMIAANVAAAETLEQYHLPTIYRVHDRPDEEKWEATRNFLKSIDYPTDQGQKLQPKLINQILKLSHVRDEAHLISQVILRAQSQAIYDTKNIGHFGLNLPRYAHFTSPIRRYADLTIHRGLIAARNLGKGAQSEEEAARLQKIAEDISMTERASMAAERESKDRFLAAFLEKQIGAEFSGRIAGVTRAGLFVMLDHTGADGFIPARSLGDEYFTYIESANALIGEQSAGLYRLGQAVQVRLKEVTPLQGSLLFEMLSDPEKGKKLPGDFDKRYARPRKSTGPKRRRKSKSLPSGKKTTKVKPKSKKSDKNNTKRRKKK